MLFFFVSQFKIFRHILKWSEIQCSVAAFERFGINVHIEMCISDNWFIFFGSCVVKIENICYTCSICQGTKGNYLVLSWSAVTGREGLEHLELVSG